MPCRHRKSNGRYLSHFAERGRHPVSGCLCHRASPRTGLVTGHVRGRALDRDRGTRDLGGFHRAQQHLKKSTDCDECQRPQTGLFVTPRLRSAGNAMQLSKRFMVTLKIVPTVIWLLFCIEGVTKSESFDLSGAAAIDIDETIDLQINALAALAMLAYLAQKQESSCERSAQSPRPHDPASDRGTRREVGESIAVAAAPPPSPAMCDR